MTAQNIVSRPAEAEGAVCIIGMGYVGLTLAVALANAGYRVFGIERVAHIRNCISSGRAHFFENGLDEALVSHIDSGSITCAEALPPKGSTTTFIVTVGTPLGPDGTMDERALENALTSIGPNLASCDMVILRSTVAVGTTRRVAKRTLDSFGIEYRLAFCPERTLEGRALEELATLPQVVAGIDCASTDAAAAFFSKLTKSIVRMNTVEGAELTKLINNTQRDLQFAFANEVAQMCDSIGVSARDVINAACEGYPRSSIALPGLVGGPCLEKDPHILAQGLARYGYRPSISLAGRALNEKLPEESVVQMAAFLDSLAAPVERIAILGVAFKGRPETSDLRGSMVYRLLRELRRVWPAAEYAAFDPLVGHDQMRKLGVAPFETVEDAVAGAALVVLQNNHRIFSEIDMHKLSVGLSDRALVYDFWSQFDQNAIEMAEGRYYRALGSMMIVRPEGELKSSDNPKGFLKRPGA